MQMNSRVLRSATIALLTMTCALTWAENSDFVERQILAETEHYAAAWNRGDMSVIDATHHPSYVHVTPDGPVTLQQRRSGVEERLDASQDHGILRFHQMTVRPLGDDYALAYGQATLRFKNGTETSVWFTSVYLRTPDGWKAVHDHG